MLPTDQHRAVEVAFGRLVESAGLPEPDRAEYHADGLTFFWEDTKTAVIVDFDDAPPDAAKAA